MRPTIRLVFLLVLAAINKVELKSDTEDLLVQKIRLSNLGKPRAGLQHLSSFLFGSGGKDGKKYASVLLPAQQSSSGGRKAKPVTEAINRKGGVAESLVQTKIDSTAELLRKTEKNIIKSRSSRLKRQVDKNAILWTDSRVNYFFDAGVDVRMRTITQKALHYIQSRTCVSFAINATAPNRVRVISGAGCWSMVGMNGGEQNLSLGNGCDVVGIAAHEFAHTLGVFHTQMRDDRDNFLTVDLTNVPPGYHGNFAKLPRGDVNNYTPYEYGSYMHYASNTFASSGNSMIPNDPLFLRTLGSRSISFYDIKTINDRYGCSAHCGTAPVVCSHGGEPNPKNCTVCNCPAGYGGPLCNKRPAGCGEVLMSTNLWKVNRFVFGNSQDNTLRDNFMLCNHWISAPAGKMIQIRVTYMSQMKCDAGCRVNSIEPKVLADEKITNPRICCADMLYKVYTSALNPTPVVSYNRLLTTTFTFHYRYIS